MYPVVFFDALRVKSRDEAVVRSKAVYLALAVRPDGTRGILGIWVEQTEGATFWLKVFRRPVSFPSFATAWTSPAGRTARRWPPRCGRSTRPRRPMVAATAAKIKTASHTECLTLQTFSPSPSPLPPPSLPPSPFPLTPLRYTDPVAVGQTIAAP
jgi:hypothetical protein